MQTAFFKGITGQDGSYIPELLISKGYKEHGPKRRRFKKCLKTFF